MKQFLWMMIFGLLMAPCFGFAAMYLLPRIIPSDPLSETDAALAVIGLYAGGFLGFIAGGVIGERIAHRPRSENVDD